MVERVVLNAYVYALVVDGIIRYIGKGTGDRVKDHMRHTKRLAKKLANGKTIRTNKLYSNLLQAWLNGSNIEELILVQGITESWALQLEKDEIYERQVSQLWNTREGGGGVTVAEHNDPSYREKYLAAMASDEYRETQKINSQRMWDTPGFREQHREALLESQNRPEVRKNISEGTRKGLYKPGVLEARRESQIKAFAKPEYRANKGIKSKAMWEDPILRENVLLPSLKKGMHSPKAKAKSAATRKKNANTPDGKLRMKIMAKLAVAKREENARMRKEKAHV